MVGATVSTVTVSIAEKGLLAASLPVTATLYVVTLSQLCAGTMKLKPPWLTKAEELL